MPFHFLVSSCSCLWLARPFFLAPAEVSLIHHPRFLARLRCCRSPPALDLPDQVHHLLLMLGGNEVIERLTEEQVHRCEAWRKEAQQTATAEGYWEDLSHFLFTLTKTHHDASSRGALEWSIFEDQCLEKESGASCWGQLSPSQNRGLMKGRLCRSLVSLSPKRVPMCEPVLTYKIRPLRVDLSPQQNAPYARQRSRSLSTDRSSRK